MFWDVWTGPHHFLPYKLTPFYTIGGGRLCQSYSLGPTKFFDIPTPLDDACNVLYMSQLALLDFTRSTGILFFFFIIMKRNKPKYYSHFVKKLAKVEQKKRLYIVYVAQ